MTNLQVQSLCVSIFKTYINIKFIMHSSHVSLVITVKAAHVTRLNETIIKFKVSQKLSTFLACCLFGILPDPRGAGCMLL
jgi:hypothetical protein